MRETEFIDQNKEKWLKLEELEASKKKDPELVSELFIEATNDLSYSKSYYSNRSIRIYLNNLALKVHSSVYKTRHSTWQRIKGLWLEEIPLAYYQSRKSVLISFLVFFASVFIGWFSASKDPGFVGLMLSEGYIEMTMQNIEEGKPMAVYASESEMNMFSYITLNNIRVAFVTFVLGIFWMIGTIAALVNNGAMLGAFHYMFYENGLLQESLLTVWMHGTPEIAAIILAGAAGLELGGGLIKPNSYLRKESFLIGAKRGLLLLVGVIPVFFFAGFIEGFATRHTEINDYLRLTFILLSLGFILTYFVLIPKWKFAKNKERNIGEEQVPERVPHDYKLSGVKSNSMVFADVFALYASKFTSFILPIVFISIFYVLGLYAVLQEDFVNQTSVSTVGSMIEVFDGIGSAVSKVSRLFQFNDYPVLWILNSLMLAAISVFTLYQIQDNFKGDKRFWAPMNFPPNILRVLLISFLVLCLFFLPDSFGIALLILISPLVLIIGIHGIIPASKNIPRSAQLTMAWKNGYFKQLGSALSLFGIGLLFLVLFNSGAIEYLMTNVLQGIKMEHETYQVIYVGVNVFFTVFGLLMLIPLFIFSGYFSYWSAYEVETANELKIGISQIGIRDKAYGILREER